MTDETFNFEGNIRDSLDTTKPEPRELLPLEEMLYMNGIMEVTSKIHGQYVDEIRSNATFDSEEDYGRLLWWWFKQVDGEAPAIWADEDVISETIQKARVQKVQLHENLINMILTHPKRDLIVQVGTMQILNSEQKKFVAYLHKMHLILPEDYSAIKKAQSLLNFKLMLLGRRK